MRRSERQAEDPVEPSLSSLHTSPGADDNAAPDAQFGGLTALVGSLMLVISIEMSPLVALLPEMA